MGLVGTWPRGSESEGNYREGSSQLSGASESKILPESHRDATEAKVQTHPWGGGVLPPPNPTPAPSVDQYLPPASSSIDQPAYGLTSVCRSHPLIARDPHQSVLSNRPEELGPGGRAHTSSSSLARGARPQSGGRRGSAPVPAPAPTWNGHLQPGLRDRGGGSEQSGKSRGRLCRGRRETPVQNGQAPGLGGQGTWVSRLLLIQPRGHPLPILTWV